MTDLPLRPIRFIGESITVTFDEAPALEKTPHCPQAFTWGDETLAIVRSVSERVDVSRKGRMSANMRPDHLATAAQRGSWGVGRFTFQVEVSDGRFFEIYYDRAPSAGSRKGGWFLLKELEPQVR